MRPLTIAVDVDEVCLPLIPEWIMRYNRVWKDNLTPDQLTGWDISKYVKAECGRKVFDILQDPDLYDWIIPYGDTRPAISLLRARGHRVVFVTSCPKGTRDQKVSWLERWGLLTGARSYDDFIDAHDKSLIQADVLIDDGMHNVRAWPRTAILITRPHNVNEVWPLRASGLLDAAQMIDRLHPMAIRLSA